MALTLDLSGRVVLVTGASRGIGKALAEGLAQAGATVAVHYHQNREVAERLAAQLGRDAQAFGADLADVAACQRLFEEVLAVYGRLDVLINNAGVAIGIELQASPEVWLRAWEQTLAVNLRAAALLCHLAIAQFLRQGGGRIINIASRAAFRGDTPEYMAYAASKGGLVALTRSIARSPKLGRAGIRAFVVAPGFTRTDMAQDFIDRYGPAIALGDLALERLTEPQDLVPLVVLLASGMADHATGCTIDVNAGSYVH
ncbi:SDR family NAD(P)-dependent oxidoreductase [Rhodothermus bifroesti]|mgnify:FL=1|jgi:NAD(P)-dependent dehydrogenase (short-subunit alcohol dehydrogenase family)|uniref:SDR family oxidoreductase n=1 Tax=Rhodothermus marinus TaxID=29549 RepID=A0A7V2AZX4_RHOMR|nr:SDR family NAD(P)-dependent oxidoreductase [Rhodothermus bifroesti]GBD02634.1 3-oxoacyl-[acyl-carrier-protein] reductase FabG [bacterium HR18]